MMNVAVSLRNIASRVAALALLAGLVTATAFVVVLPVWERRQDLDDRIAAERLVLGRYLASAAERLSGTDSGALAAPLAAEVVFLKGETDPLRLASLQTTLNTAAAAQKIRLASTQSLASAEEGGVRFLSLRVQLSTELGPLQKLLYDLELQQPNLIVDSLHITRAPESGPAHMPQLDVTLLLRGPAPMKVK